MADKNDGGDKTEQPTPKKLLDARKKGQIPKSKDLTSTVELLVWFGLAVLALGPVTQQLGAVMEAALASIDQPFAVAAPRLAGQALQALLLISAWLLLPAAVSLALFAWLLTLHPTATGRVYAAYGGVYIGVAMVWLMAVDKVRPLPTDWLGVAVSLAGMVIIMLGRRAG